MCKKFRPNLKFVSVKRGGLAWNDPFAFHAWMQDFLINPREHMAMFTDMYMIIDWDYDLALMKACVRGDAQKVKNLLGSGAHLNVKDLVMP